MGSLEGMLPMFEGKVASLEGHFQGEIGGLRREIRRMKDLCEGLQQCAAAQQAAVSSGREVFAVLSSAQNEKGEQLNASGGAGPPSGVSTSGASTEANLQTQPMQSAQSQQPHAAH